MSAETKAKVKVNDDPALARIEAALACMGDEHAPPVGWQARVLAASSAPQPRRWWRLLAVPALAGAAAATVGAWPRRESAPASAPLALELTLERGGPVVRGTSAHLGDTVHASARGGRHRAVWIYRNDDVLVVACPGGATCRQSGDAVTADAELRARGAYSVVVLAADAPLPAPSGRLDEDVARAADAGARYRIEALVVQ